MRLHALTDTDLHQPIDQSLSLKGDGDPSSSCSVLIHPLGILITRSMASLNKVSSNVNYTDITYYYNKIKRDNMSFI
jgi:hypothetical protein